MGFRSGFVIGGALLLLVALISSLSVEGLHLVYGQRSVQPILRRGCGKSLHQGVAEERAVQSGELKEGESPKQIYTSTIFQLKRIKDRRFDGSHPRHAGPDGDRPELHGSPEYHGWFGGIRKVMHFLFGFPYRKPDGMHHLRGRDGFHLLGGVDKFRHHSHRFGRQGGFSKHFHDGERHGFFGKLRRLVRRAVETVWPWTKAESRHSHRQAAVDAKSVVWVEVKGGALEFHRKRKPVTEELLVAKSWPEKFTVNFTTRFGAATGFLAYDWTLKRQVILHGPNSPFCTRFGVEEACHTMVTPTWTYFYVPSAETCSLTPTKNFGARSPEWTTNSEYVGTIYIPGTGQCNGFALPNKHLYYETVDGGLPCAFTFKKARKAFHFLPETFKVGTPEEKLFDIPDYCFPEGTRSAEAGDSTALPEKDLIKMKTDE